jgi:UDP-N-acetyl-alpha-D-muramoyl-L-alanyl-L-glutamate epimerase
VSPTERYQSFIFESYTFDSSKGNISFCYSFDGERLFTEVIELDVPHSHAWNDAVLERTLRFAWLIAGISYYKSFPCKKVLMREGQFTAPEAALLNTVYKHGLSQFIFENNLVPDITAHFEAGSSSSEALLYNGEGNLVLQSGGKDSLLLATLLTEKAIPFTAWYMTSSDSHPAVLNGLGAPLRTITRRIDKSALRQAHNDDGLNGHVPVTFITLTYALIDAVLHDENTVLAAIGREGEEPHAYVGDFAITHQWSKTWSAEQLFQNFIHEQISANLFVGSPLRGYSELKIAEYFSSTAWSLYGRLFSSCNVANYGQGHNNSKLAWCGECPKCANSFLLFAPFIAPIELTSVFNGSLFQKESLLSTFEGLFGLNNAIKPFECVGEIDELRYAYHAAIKNGHMPLPFKVPASKFDKDALTAAQPWAQSMIQ